MKNIVLLILSVVCLLPCSAKEFDMPFAAPSYTDVTAMKFHTSPIEIGNEQQFESSLNSCSAAVVFFYAQWCGPCKVMRVLINQMADKYKTAAFLLVDVDAVPSIVTRFGIKELPTTLFFRNSVIKKSCVGGCNASTFDEYMSAIL